METIAGPIIEQSEKLYDWYQDKMDSFIDRSKPERKREMSIKLELSEKTAQRIILSLVNKGFVAPVGGGRYIKYKVVEN